ncbi:mediator complex subunit [Lithohypha guttulata]|uniref:mediator complex subunit n=1 Tax=Lithohypha guttulata TaxID=1690604 RepID=UPI002DE1D5F9|nr:mediator complex subunit [Lithohypha guttulata]
MADCEVKESGIESFTNSHGVTDSDTQARNQTSRANGGLYVNSNAVRGTTTGTHPIMSMNKSDGAMNGIINSHLDQSTSLATLHIAQLPEELLESFKTTFPDDVYVSVSQLVERATRLCWTDLARLLEKLREIKIRDPKDIADRIPGEVHTPNDSSKENREKKLRIWEYAEKHKRVLIKLLVILQWSAKTEENQATIALNWYLNELRQCFHGANKALGETLRFNHTWQDAAPDLHTAAEILAAGKIAALPDLGYVEERKLTAKQMLSTMRRLDNVLSVRMIVEDNIPAPLSKWRIHDGRVIFTMPHEFEISLSVMDEEPDAKFQTVDVTFIFWPKPTMSQFLLDDILITTNHQLAERGIEGAFRFLHELTLTQKLQEFYQQAVLLTQGVWSGHLEVEMIKRTLVVQYWTRRASSKSWIEVSINSGRLDLKEEPVEYPIPYIHLRWLRYGKLVPDHMIEIDLVHLSFESILNQVVAHHIDFLFDSIYDRLAATKLFQNGDLELEQTSSLTDGLECSLSIELSKKEHVRLTCDCVAGAVVISPATDRTSRLQAELARSKNAVEDLLARFQTLRCSIVHNSLSQAMRASSWQNLPGMHIPYNELRELFGPSIIRANFFKRTTWAENWLLVASFGTYGDLWWLVHYPINGQRTVQALEYNPIHLQKSLSSGYLEKLAEYASRTITMQTNQHSALGLAVMSSLPSAETAGAGSMKVHLDDQEDLCAIQGDIVVSSSSSKRASQKPHLIAYARLRAPDEVLKQLVEAELDSSTNIDADKRLLQLRIPCAVGEARLGTVLTKLRHINDLISCMTLVYYSKALTTQRVTMHEIVIDYSTDLTSKLSLALVFEGTSDVSRVRLLPQGSNPHALILEHIQPLMSPTQGTLSERVNKLLATLRMNLALARCLQYLQGLVCVAEVPSMSTLNLAESRKWLRMHILARDIQRFGVHFFTTNAAFKHDIDTQETPQKMLVRLEIEPNLGGFGSKLGWIVRPAIEEFKNYTRPSYASHALEERLKQRLLSANDTRWLSMDQAVKCLIDQPGPLLVALHDIILEWVKEAVEEQSRATEPQPNEDAMLRDPAGPQTSHPNGQPNLASVQNMQNTQNYPPQQPAVDTMQLKQAQAMRARQQQMQRQNGHPQSFPQGRPMNSAMNVQQNGNPNMNINMNGTSRVMTAPPQQVRQPQPNPQQRRAGMNPAAQQQQQARNNQNRNQRPPPHPNDVINLD